MTSCRPKRPGIPLKFSASPGAGDPLTIAEYGQTPEVHNEAEDPASRRTRPVLPVTGRGPGYGAAHVATHARDACNGSGSLSADHGPKGAEVGRACGAGEAPRADLLRRHQGPRFLPDYRV